MINGGLTNTGETALRDELLAILNAGAGAEIDFFSDVPTDTGGTILSGNGYAASPIVLEALSTDGVQNNGAVNGATPTGTWSKAIGFKIKDENGDYYLHGELIGSPQQLTVANINTGTNVMTITGHGLPDNTRVVFRNEGGALPAGLSGAAGTEYYIISSTSDTFKVSATEGGAEIDITDVGSGIHRVFKSYFQTANPTSPLLIPDNGLTLTVA